MKKKRGQKVDGLVWSGYVIIDKKSGKAVVRKQYLDVGLPARLFVSLQAAKDETRWLSDYDEKTHSIQKVSLVVDK